jgi:hypothetical protein
MCTLAVSYSSNTISVMAVDDVLFVASQSTCSEISTEQRESRRSTGFEPAALVFGRHPHPVIPSKPDMTRASPPRRLIGRVSVSRPARWSLAVSLSLQLSACLPAQHPAFTGYVSPPFTFAVQTYRRLVCRSGQLRRSPSRVGQRRCGHAHGDGRVCRVCLSRSPLPSCSIQVPPRRDACTVAPPAGSGSRRQGSGRARF